MIKVVYVCDIIINNLKSKTMKQIKTQSSITVELDYYGNESYGKRAYYILDNNGNKTYDFIWKGDIDMWVKQQKKQGISVIIKE